MFREKDTVMYMFADGFSLKSLQRKFGKKLFGLMGKPFLAIGALFVIACSGDNVHVFQAESGLTSSSFEVPYIPELSSSAAEMLPEIDSSSSSQIPYIPESSSSEAEISSKSRCSDSDLTASLATAACPNPTFVTTDHLDSGRLARCEYGALLDERDCQVYRTVAVGSQIWMAQNLNYAPRMLQSFCYGFSADSCAKYGRLYTWSTAMDSVGRFSRGGIDCGCGKTCTAEFPVRGMCPEGWHLPNVEEAGTLNGYIMEYCHVKLKFVGYFLKSTSGWRASGNGSDTVGLAMLPAGIYDATAKEFRYAGEYAYFWSSEERFPYVAYSETLAYYDVSFYFEDVTVNKKDAYSIRCVKNWP